VEELLPGGRSEQEVEEVNKRSLWWVSTSPIFKWGEMSEDPNERWRGHDTEREQKK
jgi:hypothetical protein